MKKYMKNSNIMANRFKKLDNRGMTLVEVVASMAILAMISLGIYNGTALILKGFDIGQFVYESNSKIEGRLENLTAPGTTGSVTFNVNGTPVTVNGLYYTSSETRDNMYVSLTLFKP